MGAPRHDLASDRAGYLRKYLVYERASYVVSLYGALKSSNRDSHAGIEATTVSPALTVARMPTDCAVTFVVGGKARKRL